MTSIRDRRRLDERDDGDSCASGRGHVPESATTTVTRAANLVTGGGPGLGSIDL